MSDPALWPQLPEAGYVKKRISLCCYLYVTYKSFFLFFNECIWCPEMAWCPLLGKFSHLGSRDCLWLHCNPDLLWSLNKCSLFNKCPDTAMNFLLHEQCHVIVVYRLLSGRGRHGGSSDPHIWFWHKFYARYLFWYKPPILSRLGRVKPSLAGLVPCLGIEPEL